MMTIQLHRIKLVALLAAFMLAAVLPVNAQNELPVMGRAWGMGARALGMGGAFISVSDDYTATYWNPAGLALVRRMEFLCSFHNLKYNDLASFQGNKLKSDESFTKMDAVGFTFPVPTYRGSLVFGFGYNRVQHFDQAFGFSWYNNTITDYDNPDLNDLMTESWDTLEKGHLGQYAFSGAMDVSPNLSIGASLNLWRGKSDFESTYNLSDDHDEWDLNKYTEDNMINSKLSASNFKVGALYRLARLMRFAGTIELPYTIRIKEEAWTHIKEVWEADGNRDQKDDFQVDYKIRTPFKFSAGASLYLPQLVVSGDIHYTDWTQMEYKTDPPFSKMYPVVDENNNEYYPDSTMAEVNRDIRKKMYRSTASIHLGAEFTVPFIYTQLRAGAFYEPSPFKNADKKNDRKFITLGAGFLLDKQMKLDVAWIHGWWDRDTPYFNYDINPLTERFTINQIELTLAIRF